MPVYNPWEFEWGQGRLHSAFFLLKCLLHRYGTKCDRFSQAGWLPSESWTRVVYQRNVLHYLLSATRWCCCTVKGRLVYLAPSSQSCVRMKWTGYLVCCLLQLFKILACYLVSDSMLVSGSETVTRMRDILFTFLQNLNVAPPWTPCNPLLCLVQLGLNTFVRLLLK